MNIAITYYDLPAKEREVADLYAWGKTKKEIAMMLHKSIYTVDMQVRKLFSKSQTTKDTEFASWYFCTRFNISLNRYDKIKFITLVLSSNRATYTPTKERL